jgi:hypothetical protein
MLEDIIQEITINIHKIHMIGHIHKIIINIGILFTILMKDNQREDFIKKASIISIKVRMDTKSIIL